MVSGVGGQYNFVAQAFALEGARSVLALESTRPSRQGNAVEHPLVLRPRRPFRGICAISSSPNMASPMCAGNPMPM